MHKPESVLENETHKIFWDFKIQTDHLIQARRPDVVLIKKKITTLWILPFQRTTEGKENKTKNLTNTWILPENRKAEEHESQGNNNCSCCARNGPKEPEERTGEIENQWKNRNHPDNNNVAEISLNIETRPGDLRRLAVPQTSVKEYQLTLE